MKNLILLIALVFSLSCTKKEIEYDYAPNVIGLYNLAMIRSTNVSDIVLPKNGYSGTATITPISTNLVTVTTKIVEPSKTSTFPFECKVVYKGELSYELIITDTQQSFATLNNKFLKIFIPYTDTQLWLQKF